MMNLDNILRMTQKKLFKAIKREYSALHEKGAWLLIKGESPVLLVAHLDTVHKEPVRDICRTTDGNILMSPQGIGGDDRCGVYALMKVYESAHIKPWLLFTCDEEVGGVGACKFCDAYYFGELPKELDDIKLIIEIDRKGKDDAVYYECANKDFEAYITSKGFKTAFGSYSDICDIAPTLGIAAVNLSSGYYNAHTQHEYINLAELEATIDRVKAIIDESLTLPKYEWIEREYVTHEYFGDYWQKPIVHKADKVPDYYEQMYKELSEIYNEQELEEFREVYGDEIIEELYDDYILRQWGEAQ